MIYIYRADYNVVKKITSIEQLLCNLPEFMHERAIRYKFEKDSFNFILGRLLLKHGLSDLKINAKLEDLKYHESGKPHLNKIAFNISHTENMVVCALSIESEIGIDIEKVKQVNLEDFEAFFTQKEWEEIKNNNSPIQKFYWYWTRKESIIKALGVNLSHLHQIEVDATSDYFIDNRKKWFLRDIDFGKEYQAAICTASQEINVKRIHVDHFDFLRIK